ncbi:MAG: hypothetical protein R2724_25855 [Bryobacterales bacterium]
MESGVVVFGQDQVAVGGDRDFAEGLPGFGGKAEVLAREVLHTLHVQILDEGGRPFFDREQDGHFVFLAVIVALDARSDAYVAKTVGAVEPLDGVDVAVEQALRKAAAAQLQARLLERQSFSHGLFVEEGIPFQTDMHELLPGAALDAIDDLHQLVVVACAFGFDLGLEVALTLQIVAHVARALGEQVFVDNALFVNWQQALEQFAVGFEALDLDDQLRPTGDEEHEVDAVGGRIVIAAGDRDFRLPKALVSNMFANATNPLFQARIGEGIVVVPLGNSPRVSGAELGVPGDDDVANAGSLGVGDGEEQIDLLRLRIGGLLDLHHRRQEAVVAQHAADVLLCGGD